MINYIVQFMSVISLATSAEFTLDEKPKVSLIQTEEEVSTEDVVYQSLQKTRAQVAGFAHDDPLTMKSFDSLAGVLSVAYHREKSMTAQEIEEVCIGIDFAAEKHRFQTRKNAAKTPYISHPLGVAYNLMQIGEVRETDVIIGALLHDTVEDTQTTFEEIEQKFSATIAGLVREVTNDKTISKEMRKRMQIITASHKSKGAAQIKLADKLYNLNDLMNNTPEDWTQVRIDRYYEWAQSVVDRLPKANEPLYNAVEQIINQYWEKQTPTNMR